MAAQSDVAGSQQESEGWMMATSTPDPLRSLRHVPLTVAAELLAVSKRTLQRLIAAGEFPTPVKIGATSRVRVEDLERYIEQQRRKAGG
jgi:excisionase family DNA binding protein